MSEFINELSKVIRLYGVLIDNERIMAWSMIDKQGEADALSNLLENPKFQNAFKMLRDNNHLDITLEALIVKYKNRFNQKIVDTAERRLSHPFDPFSDK